jgi:hypothetical protein
MQLEDVTVNDLQVLIEALDAWINKDAGGDLMGDLLTAMVTKDGSMENPKVEQEKAKRRRAKEQRAETAIFIKAKLLFIKKEREQESATAVCRA